ncbi:MAG: efflux RND transporter permease subunit [Lachnospiraceae bacterium]|nr:efflux RND transporter permease subunit [Lachnospiraceae bacterium]
MLTQGQLDAAVGFSSAAQQLSMAQTQLASARSQYETSRAAALENANADALLTPQTLSQIIYAQNFSMPAGYIDDENDESWLLKIGDEFEDSAQIADSLLVEMDAIGSVRLSDVADITIIDNSDLSYSKLNGEQAVVLSIYKGSTSGTNEVSRNINEAIRELEERDPGTRVLTLMDQGEYISIIVQDLLKSMLLGALLAIIILAIFLRDIRPTFLVGLSIPLSVLFALVLMYFTDLSLNIMTLSGLSLGIGMLVDNSIVVIENIFRLRGRDMAAPRAAVQGAKQVAGAITASTLTTICVFFPMVFTTGTVRELLVPMALSISFCLIASLVVAMTVVPAASSTVFRRFKPKNSKVMDSVQNLYGKTLRWCLRHKIITVSGAVALLVLCIIRLINMGIVIIPDISGEDIQVTIVTPEEDERAESYKKVDEVLQAIMDVDGVESVGIMDSSSTTGLISSMQANSSVYGSYVCYVTPESGEWSGEMKELCKKIEDATGGFDCEITVSTGGMSDMTALMASGLTINISGNDLETLNKVSEDVMDVVAQVNGFTNIRNGSEDAAKTLHLVIDRDKAMSYGLTVAQIYAQIAQRLTTSVTSTTITTGGEKLEVVILDKTDRLTRENILDMEFEAADMTQAAGAAGSSGMDAAALAAMTGADGSGQSAGTASSESKVHKLGEFATLEETSAQGSITRKNLNRYISVTAETEEGYNLALLSRKLEEKLSTYEAPQGYKIEIEGESSEINDMLRQMSKLMALALLFIYLVMVAQFQSLLSPFIVMFTIPLAFTGGMIGLIIANEQLSMLSLMGFLILMGTVVNNGLVFVDYANQLRIGGMERQDALVATGRTRMRPILMTAMTTILAMMQLIIGKGMGSQLGRGMAIVIASGLIYATLMTLYIIPVMYDVFFKRAPLSVDTGDDLEDAPDDAAEFIALMEAERRAAAGKDADPSVKEEEDADLSVREDADLSVREDEALEDEGSPVREEASEEDEDPSEE